MREWAITISEAGQFMCSADPALGKKIFFCLQVFVFCGLQCASQKSKRCRGSINMSKSASKKHMWKTYCASRDMWSTHMSNGMHLLFFWEFWFLQSWTFLSAIAPKFNVRVTLIHWHLLFTSISFLKLTQQIPNMRNTENVGFVLKNSKSKPLKT